MRVDEVMTRNVVYIDPETPIAKAAERMRDHNIGFLPICDKGRLVGTLTDRDITIQSVAQGRDPRLARVREIMNPQVFYCYEDEDIQKIGYHMQERDVRRMLILNREKRLVGVVSIVDIARASGEQELAGQTLGHMAETG